MARDVRRKLQSERIAHCGRHESTTHITLEENPSSDERFRIMAPEQKISPSHSRSCVHFEEPGHARRSSRHVLLASLHGPSRARPWRRAMATTAAACGLGEGNLARAGAQRADL
jgi:hypothetical protein